MTSRHSISNGQFQLNSLQKWRAVQILLFIIGAYILFSLLFYPTIGLQLFWNLLIPLAPLLLVLAVGVWRNICPLASFALLPRYLNFSKRKKLTVSQTGKLNLIGVILLIAIVPLRHALFDLNGMATALLIVSLGTIALATGFFYDWKSIWCSGLCPILPVEKLYGLNSRVSIPNAHCEKCYRCVTPCPDTTTNHNPLSVKKTYYHKLSGFLMVGGFPGFILGWFQVTTYQGFTDIDRLLSIYGPPLSGLALTCTLFFILSRFIKKKVLVPIFSAAAVSCYYWYRLPALFGFGSSENGVLIDMTDILPQWTATVAIIGTTLFFFWWLVFQKQNKISWVTRPPYVRNKII